ncbi:tagaturonate reductase [Cellulomonas soli]|uniref:Altronate oxidoreductase n=1 Tax=Cellulomonas soli TaxID=931535 RepID=A0A512PGV8_9CELL|nr:tagaturonate reductase [Cellulomonas soli]NYI59645.1 tagaturonate reductase [Cellulomonas soli]GEP70439.1 altronate oxidoreductase [Cellulomonas soli]
MSTTPDVRPADPSVTDLPESPMQQLDATTVARTPRPITVLQFGGGNFLRGFVDWMVQVANDAGVTDAGVAVVHATAQPDPAFDLLREQDGLYHVVLEGVRDGQPVREVTRVDCVQAVVAAHGEFERYRELYLAPELQVVVSNTTEAGIVYVEGDDLMATPPVSFPAKVTALLHDRFRHYAGAADKGLAIVACELIEDNGSTLRAHVLRHAEAAGLGADFVAWVQEACSFYDTLVDRIVPGFPRADIDRIQAELGFADRLVVQAEYFHVWAIGGDARIRALLPLDRAGLDVRFMDDIRPFRAQKVRVLNGAHTALSALGLECGFTSVREAYGDPDLRGYVERLVGEEVLGTIAGDRAGLEAFAAGILERFTNPYLHHRLADIALNAVAKWRTRNLPVYVDRVRAGQPAPLTALSLAAVLLLQAGQGGVEGFAPADDADTLEYLADTFDAEALEGWVRGAVAHLDLASGLDPEQTEVLVQDAAAWATTIRTSGARATLLAALAGAQTSGALR